MRLHCVEREREREREREIRCSHIKHETLKKVCCTSRLFKMRAEGNEYVSRFCRSIWYPLSLKTRVLPWLSRLIIKSLWSSTMRFLFISNSFKAKASDITRGKVCTSLHSEHNQHKAVARGVSQVHVHPPLFKNKKQIKKNPKKTYFLCRIIRFYTNNPKY